jgi:hypothetical protein
MKAISFHLIGYIMQVEELIYFLNNLKNFVPGYWRGRIEEVIIKLGGVVKPKGGYEPAVEEE